MGEHIVCLSGGKDSTAMASRFSLAWMVKTKPPAEHAGFDAARPQTEKDHGCSGR